MHVACAACAADGGADADERADPGSLVTTPRCVPEFSRLATITAREPLTWTGPAGRCSGCVATTALTAVMIAAQLAGLDPPRPAPAARHDRHRGPRPGPGRRVLHPPRDRPGLRRSATPPASPCSTGPRWWLGALLGLLHVARRPDRPRPAAARRPPAHGVAPGRPGIDRRAGAARAARPQLRRRRPRSVAIAAHLVYGIVLGLLLAAR